MFLDTFLQKNTWTFFVEYEFKTFTNYMNEKITRRSHVGWDAPISNSSDRLLLYLVHTASFKHPGDESKN